jgi:transposase
MDVRTQNATPVLTTIGIDIGKDIFHIVGFDADGKIALRRKIKRSALAYTPSAREKVPEFLDWRLPIPGS